MLHKIFNILKSILGELIIVILLLIVANNYILKVNDHIGFADGKGYYEYLPSTFIRHDMQRNDFSVNENLELYKSVQSAGIYDSYGDFVINKYTCGTALLQSPFFFGAYLLESSNELSGYEPSFQLAIYISTIFYLFLGLIFFRKLLVLYEVNPWSIFFTQFVLVFATSALIYTLDYSSYSHIYSFFAITLFLYLSKSYFVKPSLKQFLLLCAILGLIFITRQVNILILFALPFIAGEWNVFKSGILHFLKKPKWLLFGTVIIFSVVFIQMIFWYLQTGEFIVYSYQDEGFNFLNPEFTNILFSYRKGLFVYTPILIGSILGVLVLLFLKKEYYLGLTWLAFFLFLSYVFSSWHAWEYGASYGSRPFIDFYAILFIPFAFLFSKVNVWLKSLLLFSSLFLVFLNILQTYQYQSYIFHWINMDKKKYWSVFMETGEQFNGIFWEGDVNESEYDLIKKFSMGEVEVAENEELVILEITPSDSIYFDAMNLMSISFQSDFKKEMSAKIHLQIDDSTQNYFWHERPLLHFYTEKFNSHQEGKHSFTFPTIENSSSKRIVISIINPGENVVLSDVRIKFQSKK